MEKKSYLFAITLLAAVAIVAAIFVLSTDGPGGCQVAGKTCVAVSILPLAEFVEQVGGDRVSVTVMVPPGASPHTYEPAPGQLTGLGDADVFFTVGSGVEFELQWMDRLIEMNDDMLIVNCSSGLSFMGNPDGEHAGGETGGDGGNDPHVWLSPRNAVTMVENVYDGLVQVDPGNASFFALKRDAYIQELRLLDSNLTTAFQGMENRILMVYHPSWGYFCRDYNLTQMAIEDDGKEPTAEGLANLIDQAVANNVVLIFASPEYSHASAQTIADQVEARVVLVSPMSRDYISNLRQIAEELGKD